jgi:subtilisin family serine protease
VQSAGFRIHYASRFLNALSVYADSKALALLESLEFVIEARPVARLTRPVDKEDLNATIIDSRKSFEEQLDYGPSQNQIRQMRVNLLHEHGLTGHGVMIGFLDTGFKIDHPAFAQMHIVATRDFINGDDDVDDGDPSQLNHGTAVLSAAGAAVDGELYGPAYKASFALAKTEIEGVEIQIEEDNFVAALEWADSIGCDIVSASLGYIEWYTFEDMNGDNAVTTRACDIAVSRGIAVFAAAGNERNKSWGHIVSPGDGDSVITVGAVDQSGEITSFSSPGPTSDGRIKPDICAQGSSVSCANYSGGYGTFSGTSAATPLAAGAAALLLELHPDWGPMDLRTAVWSTGQRSAGLTYPNNDYGYGILDAAAASGLYPIVPTATEVTAYPNPFRTWIAFRFPDDASEGIVTVFALDGSKVLDKTLLFEASPCEYRWDGENEYGNEVASGLYIVKLSCPGFEETIKIAKVE